MLASGLNTLLSMGELRGYAYDYAGNNVLESWTIGYDSSGSRPNVTMTRSFNVAGELDAMSGGMNDSSQPNFPYFYQAGVHTPFGPLSEQLGNGLSRNSLFDANGRDAGRFVCAGSIQPDCGGGTFVYGYRDTITGQQATHLADSSLQRTSDLQYDEMGRLKGMTSDSGLNMAWTYDRYGNRYSQAGGGGGMSVPQPQFSFDTATNRISGYSYDAAGNMTNDGLHTYAYDVEGNMTVVGGVATNFYDALNRRVAQSTSGLFERYEYNAQGQISDVWWNEEQYEHIARYVANGQPLAYFDTGGNVATARVHYQHADYLGTVRFVTSSTGTSESAFRSLPFGESYSFLGPDDDRSHFAGLDRDTESDTHHAQFRQYSSTQGRWMSPDPFGGSYDITDPQSFNRSIYAGNQPLSAFDPSGLDYIDQGGNPCFTTPQTTDSQGNLSGGGISCYTGGQLGSPSTQVPWWILEYGGPYGAAYGQCMLSNGGVIPCGPLNANKATIGPSLATPVAPNKSATPTSPKDPRPSCTMVGAKAVGNAIFSTLGPRISFSTVAGAFASGSDLVVKGSSVAGKFGKYAPVLFFAGFWANLADEGAKAASTPCISIVE